MTPGPRGGCGGAGGDADDVADLGRSGYRAAGVPLSGAADAVALRITNLLVGNAESAVALEFTLIGPELEFCAMQLSLLVARILPDCRDGNRCASPPGRE